jgi:hypothetical protein
MRSVHHEEGHEDKLRPRPTVGKKAEENFTATQTNQTRKTTAVQSRLLQMEWKDAQIESGNLKPGG